MLGAAVLTLARPLSTPKTGWKHDQKVVFLTKNPVFAVGFGSKTKPKVIAVTIRICSEFDTWLVQKVVLSK